jgi:hypothetical protein
MTQLPGQLLVAPSGSVYVAPVGTTQPTHEYDALNAAFKELGLITPDGVTLRDGTTMEDIRSWQRFQPTRKTITEANTQLIFTLQQWNQQTVKLAFGGTVAYTSGPHFKLTPRQPSDGVDERCVVLEWQDDAHFSYRIVIQKCTLGDVVETQLTRSGEAQLPITLDVLGADSGPAWYAMTNNGAWGS